MLKAVALVVAKSSSAVAIDSSSFPSFSYGSDLDSGAAILLSKSAHSRPAKRIYSAKGGHTDRDKSIRKPERLMERGRLPTRNGNPFEGRPVTGPNTPLGKGASEITCLSCQPHHSQYANLMRPDVPNQMAVCETCHKF